MNNSTFSITTADGHIIKGIKWETTSIPIAAVCIVHGLGEHQGRYHHVCEKLVSENMVVYTFDQRGHGLSNGKRGHFKNYDSLLTDLDLVISRIKSENPEKPFVLYAHSFGGNVGLSYLTGEQGHKVSFGLITSPWITLPKAPPASKLLLARIAKIIMPSYSESSKLITTYLSSDIEIVKNYENDPLVHDRISASAYLQITEAGKNLFAKIHRLKTPLLLAHGSSDQITDHNSTQKLAMSNRDLIDLKIWDGLKHETHNELNWEEVVNFYLDWIKNKIR